MPHSRPALQGSNWAETTCAEQVVAVEEIEMNSPVPHPDPSAGCAWTTVDLARSPWTGMMLLSRAYRQTICSRVSGSIVHDSRNLGWRKFAGQHGTNRFPQAAVPLDRTIVLGRDPDFIEKKNDIWERDLATRPVLTRKNTEPT